MIAHWDDVERSSRPVGANPGGRWSDLGRAAGTRGVGVRRIELGPGEVSTPAHVHGDAEEIFYVLEGAGLSWQDGETYEIRAGDCIVHPALGPAHTLKAGDDGLDVLAFGHRTTVGGTHLPRAGVSFLGPSWVEAGRGEQPFAREPELELPQATRPRPGSIVHRDDVPTAFEGRVRSIGAAAGSARAGLGYTTLPPGGEGAPPHCHSAEEEIFVVLEGSGTLELEPAPVKAEFGAQPESHPVRRGHVVSRPPGSAICHSFRAGDEGLTYLAYGTREPTDTIYYGRAGTIFFKGLGLVAKPETVPWLEST